MAALNTPRNAGPFLRRDHNGRFRPNQGRLGYGSTEPRHRRPQPLQAGLWSGGTGAGTADDRETFASAHWDTIAGQVAWQPATALYWLA